MTTPNTTQSDKLGSLTAKEFKKIIPHIIPSMYTTADFANNTDHIIELLLTLKAKHTFKFMKIIDSFYPGLSFHFIMEARSSFTKANAMLLFRVSYHLAAKPEEQLFAPMRIRLIKGLLFDDDSYTRSNKSLFEQIKNAINSIESLPFLIHDKEALINKVLSLSFEQFYNINYTLYSHDKSFYSNDKT